MDSEADGFGPGQLVRMKRNPARRGIISDIFVDANNRLSARVFFDGSDHPWVDCAELEADVPFNSRHVSVKEFMRDLALAKIRHSLSDSLYSVGTSRTEFAPYQFRPVLKFLRAWQEQEKRGLLIADEVGLGKTIEAAIILQELKARTVVERVLIVCPGKLTRKWQDELRLRFNESFQIWRSDDVRRLLQQEVIPPFRAIASLETLRRADMLELLQDQRLKLDYLVIDESHYLRNSDSRSFRLGSLLSDIADAVVLLSATPVHLQNDNLRNLLQLVDPAEFRDTDLFRALLEPNRYINEASAILQSGMPKAALKVLRKVEQTAIRERFLRNPWYRDIVRELGSLPSEPAPEDKARLSRALADLNTFSSVINRTRKREFKDIAQRDPYSLKVCFSPEERELYEAIDRHVRARLRQIHDRVAGFATVMRERQAASCLPVMADVLKAIAAGDDDPDYEQTEFEPELPEAADEATTPTRRVDSSLDSLIRQASALEHDTKYDLLLEQLRSILNEAPGRKVLLFSYFKRTLDYLNRRLRANGIRTSVIHGNVPTQDRINRIDEFRTSPQGQVLLSSEVGAEGLDFQFCDVLVNYDLPWNPMQIEQRIGRLDRFGRDPAKKIRILNFFIDDTIETRIFEKLYDRIQIFRNSVGELEEILGSVVTNLTEAMLSPDMTLAQLEERSRHELDRLANERLELERFNQEEQALLGQGSILDARVNDMIAHGRVLTGTELLALVQTWLSTAYNSRSFEQDPEEIGGIVRFDGQLGLDFDRFCQRRQLAPPTDSCLIRAKAARHPCPVTFNPGIAQERRNVEFITMHHPLVQMAVEYWRERQPADGSLPLACLEIIGDPTEAGDAWFFIYRVHVASVQDRQQLEVIILHEESGVELPNAATALLGAMQRLEVRDVPGGRAAAETWATRGQQLMADRKRQIEAHEQQQFEARSSALIASLRATTEAKIARRREQLASVTNANILRMGRAEIANRRTDLEHRIREITSRATVSVHYEPIAGGKLHIAPDPDRAPKRDAGFRALTTRWASRR